MLPLGERQSREHRMEEIISVADEDPKRHAQNRLTEENVDQR